MIIVRREQVVPEESPPQLPACALLVGVRPKATSALLSLLAASVELSPAAAQPSAATPKVPVVLTPDERALLARGEMSGERHVLGIVVSVMPGLGLGHVIQGRWKEQGWIFTLGEFVAFGLIAVAASESDLDTSIVGAAAVVGWGSFLGLRVWEVVDAASAPRRHNRKVRALRAKAGVAYRPAGPKLQMYLAAPLRDGARMPVAGIALSF